MKNIKIGIQLSARRNTLQDWKSVKALVLECENLEYDSIWFGDHLFGSRLECWTLLSALSAITKRIRLGTLVLCNSFRNPSLLAKMAATLDLISQGRLEFGLGAGWSKEEHEAYGFVFPKPHIRVEQLREGLEVIKRMWTTEKPSYTGKYYQIINVPCEPKPLQKPHPPITIGGGGERYTLKVVAAYADRWNLGGPVKQYRHKLGILKKYCVQIDRDIQEIEKSYFSFLTSVYTNENELGQAMKRIYTTTTPYRSSRASQGISFESWLNWARSQYILGTPQECLKKMRELMDVGVTYFMVKFPRMAEKSESLKFFAEEVVSQIR